MKIKTVIISIIFFLYAIYVASAEMFFTGYTGAKGDFYAASENVDSENADSENAKGSQDEDTRKSFEIQAYFAGQLNISKKLMVRGEFSIQSENIFKTELFEEKESIFCINEISSTYVKPFLGNTQYISAFFGTFEPIGSDVFLQRQFGIKPITSLLTESWLGLRGSYIYPFYGAGASYILHFDQWPIASGFYLYMNHADNESDDDQVNLDWRFASSNSYFTADFAAGIGAPLSKKYGDNDVILVIDTVYLHTGAEVLIGNRYRHSLFVQAGFEQVTLRAKDDNSSTDDDKENTLVDSKMYFLFEPRFTMQSCKIHFTFFNFPASLFEKAHSTWQNKKLIFIEDPIGINMAIFSDSLFIKNKNITFGLHTTLSFPDKYLFDMKDFSSIFDDYNIKISPFLTIPIMTGEFHLMLQANLMKMTNVAEAFKLNIGYKAQL